MLRNQRTMAGLAAWAIAMVGGLVRAQEPAPAKVDAKVTEAVRSAEKAVEAADQRLQRITRLVRLQTDPALTQARKAKERALESARVAVAARDKLLAQAPESSAKPKITDPNAATPGTATTEGYLLLAPQVDAEKAGARENWRKAMINRGYLAGPGPGVADDGLLGLSVVPADELLREQLGLGTKGLVVTAVGKGSPADRARFAEKDILIVIGEKDLTAVDQLKAAISGAKAGPIPLQVLRAGEKVKVELRAVDPEEGKRKAEAERARAHAEKLAGFHAKDHEKADGPKFWIGISVNEIDATLRSHLKLKDGAALVVNQVVEGSPAEKAGLRKNDVFLEHDGKPFKAPADLIGAVQEVKDQAGIKIKFLRKGTPQFITVKPEARPKEVAQGKEGNNPQAGLDANTAKSIEIYQKIFRGMPDERPEILLNLDRANLKDPAAPGRPMVFVTTDVKPSPIDAKIDELTRKVEALTKAVEALKERLPEASKSKK